MHVYNLYIWTCTKQVSVWVGVNVFKHCGFLIITSMGGFLLHQRIVCSLHECVCVSVCVSLCVSLCVLYQRIVCSLHKCVCVSVCVCSKCPCGYLHITIRGATLLCAHTHRV